MNTALAYMDPQTRRVRAVDDWLVMVATRLVGQLVGEAKLGDRLGFLLKKYGLTPEVAAADLAVTSSDIRAWANGSLKPSDAAMAAISLRFGVSRKWVLTGVAEHAPDIVPGAAFDEELERYVRGWMPAPKKILAEIIPFRRR